MPVNCDAFSTYILQRTLNFLREMAKDRNPSRMEYSDVYKQDSWDNFTGTLHTWDRIHVARFNDDGCWTEMDEENCLTAICDPPVKSFGWGMTRANFGKLRNKYKSPVFCLDQWNHFREAKQALSAIVEGFKMQGPVVYSDFMRLFSLRSADRILVINNGADASAPFTEITVSDAMFTNACKNLTLGLSAADLSAVGQISMQALMRLENPLLMNGYFDRQYKPGGLMSMFTDTTTINRLVNENPALFGRYDKKDFAQGGQFYSYGAVDGAGDWAFKVDMTPLRFTNIGGGVLQRVFPWENIPATIGKRPVYSNAYEQATYQLYHVVNSAARTVYGGSLEQINPDMPFITRNVMGEWKWHRPMANFSAADPCTGEICEYDGTEGNKGFWTMEHQLGVKTTYPEIEAWILAKRAPQTVAPNPLCPADSALLNYYPYPYNCLCEQE